MSSTSRSLLATMISLALFGPTVAYANQAAPETANGDSAVNDETDELAMVRGVCIAPEQMPADPNNEPIKVTADQAEALNNQSVTYTGDVVVRQGNRTVAADVATLEQPVNIVTA